MQKYIYWQRVGYDEDNNPIDDLKTENHTWTDTSSMTSSFDIIIRWD